MSFSALAHPGDLLPALLRPGSLAALFAASGWVHAVPQESPAPAPEAQVVQLDEVLVTAPRSARPATASGLGHQVFTAKDLARTGERSLPRQIERAAGVWVQETNLGGGAPIVRGLVGNQVLIVVDGVRLNDSSTRTGPNQSLNSIDPAIVDRVEVIRGPASVLWGSDALGGAILIWTKRRRAGSDGPTVGTDLLGISSVEGGRASVFGSTATDTWGVLGVGSYQTFEDLRAGDGETQEFTGYDGYGGFGSLERDLGEQRTLRLTARVWNDDDVPRTDTLTTGFPTEVGGAPTPPSDLRRHFDPQLSGQLQLNYTDRARGDFADTFEARVALRTSDERRERITVGSPNTLRVERDEVTALSVGLDWRRAHSTNQMLSFGLDLQQDWIDSSQVRRNLTTGAQTDFNGSFAPDSRYTTAGVFAQNEWFGVAGWDFTFGVRGSFVDFAFDAFEQPVAALPDDEGGDGSFGAASASLQAARDLATNWRISQTLASGYRAPNLQELAAVGDFFGGVELPNPDLDPEQSLFYEIGVDTVQGRWKGGVAAFVNHVDDAIGRVFDADASAALGDTTYRRENQGRLLLWGLDAAASVRLGGTDSPWHLDGRMAYVRGRQYDDTIDEDTGEAPLDGVEARRIPPLFGAFGPTFVPNEMLFGWIDRAGVELVFAARQDQLHPDDISDPRIDPNGTPGWGRLDLFAEGPLGKSSPQNRWRFGVQNALDKNYRVHASGFDAPGITAYLGISLAF